MFKKIIYLFSFCFLLSGVIVSTPSKYRINEQNIDKMMTAYPESCVNTLNDIYNTEFSKVAEEEEKTRNGYLVRACFCGSIGLHRSYMGTNGEAVWWFYCCVPLAGPIDSMVDFWWVVFEERALEKYRNNSRFIVWMDEL